MSLYDRLIGLTEPRIPVHAFMAALGELERGKVTEAQVISVFNLDAGEQTEAAELITKIITPLESISIGGLLTLTNIGASYDGSNALRGLGWFRIQTAGISAFEFQVMVNKIGTGTQSWQLWNETDSTEITVINDAGGTGVKTLSITQNFDPPLSAAFKTVRVRAKSTTSTDDPIYFGSSLLVRRTASMTPQELHQVLLLAETGTAYGDVTSLKARLGVS